MNDYHGFDHTEPGL